MLLIGKKHTTNTKMPAIKKNRLNSLKVRTLNLLHILPGSHVEVREQLVEVSSLLPLCEFQRSNLGYQICTASAFTCWAISSTPKIKDFFPFTDTIVEVNGQGKKWVKNYEKF